MNKNLFKTFAIAAMAVLAGACAKEQVGSADGETVEMTFNVDVPEATITTKGLSDAAQVDELVFQVFLTGTKDEKKHFINTPVPELTQVVPVVDKKATVKVNLVKGQRYSYAFWAQSKDTGYYDTSDLRAVKMNTAKVKANDPKMDAFYGFKEGETASKSYSGHITLYRALAQINFGAKTLNRSDALQATASSVTLSKVPDIFHPFWKTSETSEGKGEITYANNAVVSEKLAIGDKTNKTEYDYLATVYVLANKADPMLIDASATITLSNGRTTKVSVPNAPIQVNYRTNILGDLLNVDGVWNITVDDEFKGSDKIYDPLGSDLYKGSAVTLTEDYSAFTPSGVVIPMKAVSSLDLNGYTFKNENGTALDVRGSLTINGSGQVLCDGPVGEAYAAVFVQDGGKVVINDGYYYSNNGNSCIYVQAGDKTGHTITIGGEAKPLYYGGGIVEINGGVFEAQANKFVLNQNDYIENESCFSVKGGIFVGFNPAEVNECHGKVTSFVADGYKAVETTYEGKQAWKVEAIPPVTTQEAFNSAITTANSNVVLAAGTYKLPKETVTVDGNEKSVIAEGVTIIGNGEGTVLNTEAAEKGGEGNYNAKGLNNVTFKNLTINEGQGNYNGIKHSGNIKYEKCVILGRPTSYATNVEYKDCTFKQTTGDYNIWTYASNITFDNCVFDCQGKAAMVYREGNDATKDIYLKVTFNKCVFKASAKVTGKAAIEIDSSLAPYEVYINNCTSEGFDNGTKSGNSLWNNKRGDATNLKVVVDSVPQTLN